MALVVFFYADTTTIRLLLGVASAGFAFLLMWPWLSPHVHYLVCELRGWAAIAAQLMAAGRGVQVDFSSAAQCLPYREVAPLFERPAYALMAMMPGKEFTWAGLFTLHFIGVHWRVIDSTERVNWGIAVNVLGFATWTYSTLALNIGLGQVFPGTALEWTLIFFAGWALFRTGLTKEVVTA